MAAFAAEEVAAEKPTWPLRTPPARPRQSAAPFPPLLLLLLQLALSWRCLMLELLKRLPLLVLTALQQLLFLVLGRQWKLKGMTFLV